MLVSEKIIAKLCASVKYFLAFMPGLYYNICGFIPHESIARVFARLGSARLCRAPENRECPGGLPPERTIRTLGYVIPVSWKVV